MTAWPPLVLTVEAVYVRAVNFLAMPLPSQTFRSSYGFITRHEILTKPGPRRHDRCQRGAHAKLVCGVQTEIGLAPGRSGCARSGGHGYRQHLVITRL
jgi:hypothetical protein